LRSRTLASRDGGKDAKNGRNDAPKRGTDRVGRADDRHQLVEEIVASQLLELSRQALLRSDMAARSWNERLSIQARRD
jgi:hypothetical protein